MDKMLDPTAHGLRVKAPTTENRNAGIYMNFSKIDNVEELKKSGKILNELLEERFQDNDYAKSN